MFIMFSISGCPTPTQTVQQDVQDPGVLCYLPIVIWWQLPFVFLVKVWWCVSFIIWRREWSLVFSIDNPFVKGSCMFESNLSWMCLCLSSLFLG
jgi:hypothetical protein